MDGFHDFTLLEIVIGPLLTGGIIRIYLGSQQTYRPQKALSRRIPHPGVAGFTLLELMIVVVVVGILATIAYPTYLDQVRKARRAEAKAALLENVQIMERRYTESFRYNRDGEGEAIDADDLSAVLPHSEIPANAAGTDRYYVLDVGNLTDTSYTLRATPLNAQSNDRCGTLSLTHTGRKQCSTIADGDDCRRTCW